MSLASNARDIPFAMLYTVSSKDGGVPMPSQQGQQVALHDATAPKETSEGTARLTLSLRGTIGVPAGHALAPSSVSATLHNIDPDIMSPMSAVTTPSLNESMQTDDATDENVLWPLADACRQRSPILMSNLDEDCADFELRGWQERPRQAVVIPCHGEADQTIPSAVLVVGVNAMGKWDEMYATFWQLLSRHIATGLLGVANAERDARRAESLLALDRAKTTFFSNCSHELRTPLTLILGPLEDVLASRVIPAIDRDRLRVVQRNANRLLGTVNNLLDFSRLELGRSTLTFRRCNVSEMTADLASLFRAAVERQGVEYVISCDTDPKTGKPVLVSPEMWEKVVFNLIGNAV